MKISELPKEIRKKALKYRKEDGEFPETDDLSDAFGWSDTDEGYHYWNDLHLMDGAKWQQERSYSEEEVVTILIDFFLEKDRQYTLNPVCVVNWFKQFKKK